jgi:aspartyl-tRNA(Asn)/glutamyl-tRNA(Gln) amidotransferase subunit A
MKLFPDDQETITGTAQRLRRGEISCVDVLRQCLGRIDQMEHSVRAWVLVDRQGALAQAQALDAELKAGQPRGWLHGIPIGVKDIIDVEGLPTANGLAGQRWVRLAEPANSDATVIARLRQAGAVILGKTVSTPFAWIDSPVTRNPWNFDRTPGGSSSGSAAAVAAGMCLGAIGTQTGGSITRPAAFCGICGMKPTFGQVDRQGILPLAPSLDHVGPMARSVADLSILYQVMRDPDAPTSQLEQYEMAEGRKGWMIGHLWDFLDDRMSAETHSAIQTAVESVTHGGAYISRVSCSRWCNPQHLLTAHRTVLAAEARVTHGSPKALREKYFRMEMQDWFFPPRLFELLEEGAKVSTTAYTHALALRTNPKLLSSEILRSGAFVTPAAAGPAPEPSTTGDPCFNAPWSLLGFPTVSFPIGLSADGLPLGVQLIGKPGADQDLLRIAERCESAIWPSEGTGT